MKITSKQRAELRAEAHHLTALVHVGQQGLTDAIRTTLDDALRTHELVKVQLGKQLEIPVREAASQLAESVRADVVQVIGKTATFYRENRNLEKKKGALPPWRKQ